MKMTNDDRRRFFRISDAIGVSYTLISNEEDGSEAGGHSTETEVDVTELFKSDNQAIKSALEGLSTASPEAAKAIAALDSKIEKIITLIELDGSVEGKSLHSIQQASISACGIAFPISENIPAESKINLTLFLETAGEQVSALGRVIECQSLPEESEYYLRIEFVEMKEADREKLIQHIVQRQGSLLKSLREQISGE